MKTTTNRRKSVTAALGAAAAALVAPAMLFLGTGTAQAATLVTPESNALGVTVSILSDTQWGWCSYSAEPNGGWNPGEPLPVYGGAVPYGEERKPPTVVPGHPDEHHLACDGEMRSRQPH